MKVRAVAAADVRTFVPVEPEPAQSVIDRLRGLGGVTGLIRILDPEHELAAVMTGEEPVEERGARTANVEVTCGRRREANADNGTHIENLNQERRTFFLCYFPILLIQVPIPVLKLARLPLSFAATLTALPSRKSLSSFPGFLDS